MVMITAEDTLATLGNEATLDNEVFDTLPTPPRKRAGSKRHYQQTDIEFDPKQKVLWTVTKPMGIPCCNQNMVEEFRHSFQQLQESGGEHLHEGEWHPVLYSVVASRHPTVFNLGGDLELLLKILRNRDRAALEQYAQLCVDTMHMRIRHYDAPMITISLVQGDALGGGFEFALASDLIVAEQGVRMGLPEVMFNLFPGMGAYSLLARKVGAKLAEEMMMSGNIYQSEDLHRMGIVDILAPRGEGEKAVDEFIRKRGRRFNAIRSIYQCRQHFNPVTLAELKNIGNLWIDAVMRLDESDMHIMSQLLNAQRSEQEKRINAGKGLRPRFLSTEASPVKTSSQS